MGIDTVTIPKGITKGKYRKFELEGPKIPSHANDLDLFLT